MDIRDRIARVIRQHHDCAKERSDHVADLVILAIKDCIRDFSDLPTIQCPPQPVPVGHPEHPDFRGYGDSE